MEPEAIIAFNEVLKRALIAIFLEAEENGFKEPFAIDITDNWGNTLSYTMSETGEISSLQEGSTEDSYMEFPVTVTLTDQHGRKLRSEVNAERTY
jgi:hypothetical protein